ncbi:hypothetical protein ACWENQ_33425 [Nonomuraea sp. NPDC004354]
MTLFGDGAPPEYATRRAPSGQEESALARVEHPRPGPGIRRGPVPSLCVPA